MRTSVATFDLMRAFTPPRELSQSSPREVRLTGAGRALVALGWVMAAGAVLAGMGLYAEARRQATTVLALEARGRSADAVVDRLWRKTSDGKPAFAAVHFDASGVRVDGESRMQLDAWRRLTVGSRIPVTYLPHDPRTFALAGARRERLPLFVPYIVAGSLALVSGLCAVAVRRQRSLLMEGRPAPAVVTAFHKHHSSHGGMHRSITYEFPLLGGGVASGKASVSAKAAGVGSTICVVYDPERPGRSQPYPFSLVTPLIGDRA